MEWTPLVDVAQLDAIDQLSKNHPVLIFKHSTRCAISKAALNRLEREWGAADDAAHAAYFLDLLAHRDISDAVAARYGIRHESPQVLVIRSRQCSYTATHTGIGYKDTMQALAAH